MLQAVGSGCLSRHISVPIQACSGGAASTAGDWAMRLSEWRNAPGKGTGTHLCAQGTGRLLETLLNLSTAQSSEALFLPVLGTAEVIEQR